MNRTYRDTLIEILTICGYSGDKEQFATRFEELNYDEALINTLEQLPLDVQEQIKACSGDYEKLQYLIPNDILQQEILKVSSSALTSFLEEMAPELNAQQKEAIRKLFSSGDLYPSLSL